MSQKRVSVLPMFNFQINSLKEFFFTAFRFGSVGVIATIIHIFVIWMILGSIVNSVYLANIYGFLIAFIFSFLGHYFWSFKSPGRMIQACVRFFIIASLAFLINNLLLTFLLKFNLLSPLMAAITSVFIIPIISFVASWFWGFKKTIKES